MRAAGEIGRVEVWRGGCRPNISVSAPFVWRCLTGSTLAPFPHPAHRTGHADRPHPALGQDLTPSPTTRRAQAETGVAVAARYKHAFGGLSVRFLVGRSVRNLRILHSFSAHGRPALAHHFHFPRFWPRQ